MCARKRGYEDLTKEIPRHFEAYGFLNPVIIQCDKEISIIDACRKVARERNARTVLTICAKNKSSEQRVCRSSARAHTGTRTMQPDTNRDEHWHTAFSNFTGHSICDSLRWICALKIHNATRRQNPIPIFARNSVCVSPLCMFGESVFELIPDDEVRAAKLTNRWISGCWWGRDASSDEHLVWRTKHGLLKCRSVCRKPLLESSGADVKRSKLEGRNEILMRKWTLEYLDHLWLHVQMKGCRQQRHKGRFPQYLRLHLCQKSPCLKCEVKECTRKHPRSEPSGQKSAELLDARACETPGSGKSHTLVNASRVKKPGTRATDQHQRRKRNVELLELEILDTRPLDPS